MSYSDKYYYYNKYQKYKLKYIIEKKSSNKQIKINTKRISGGEKCINYTQSESFIKFTNNVKNNNSKLANMYIKSYPGSGYKSFPAHNGYPSDIRGRENFGKQFDGIIKDLLDKDKNNIIILSLQVTNESDKHAFLFYFDKIKNNLEIFDSNGECSSHGDNTYNFLIHMVEYIENEINKTRKKKIDIITSDKNINLQDSGHCDALTLFYAILRKNSYKNAQKLFTINWEKPKNIKLLNCYIKKKDISNLLKLTKFEKKNI